LLTSAREVIINFRIKTRGLYEIVEPVLEENEVFDSSLLKETINSLIASGKRNFALDMSPLDYIYSDTINMLMALNRRVLDVTGRLSLMSPQPEVMQILKRAGIHNILKVFETETELMKSSEDMILQTTSIKLSDINAAIQQAAPPQSEFDQLRSEIGSAFGSSPEDAGSDNSSAPMSRQAPPMSSRPPAGHEDDFNQMFQQLEPQGQSQPKNNWGAPPVQPQTPKFQPQQYVPPSAPQSMPMRPSAPSAPSRVQPEPAQFSPDYSSMRSETQRFSAAPAKSSNEYDAPEISSPKKAASFDDDLFDSSKKKSASKGRVKDDFDSSDDDFHHDEFKKKSALPVIVIVVLVLILGGAGAFIFTTLQKKGSSTATTAIATPPATVPSVPVPPPALPVETQDTAVATPPASQPDAQVAEPPKEIVESKPEVASRPARRPVQRREPRRTAPAVARVAQPPRQAETKNQIDFSSSPTGAAILINGQRVGTTPFTWTKPFFGTVNVQIVKAGYVTAKKTFEFTGGSSSESFSLEREVVETPPPPPAPVVSQPSRPSVVEDQEVRAPAKTPPPPPAVEDDPFEDMGAEDDFALESEPQAPVKETPAQTPRPPVGASSGSSNSSSQSVGGEAQIFIASIPPVADVYIGDKLVGKTNVSELKLPAGTQSVRFVKGGKEITKEITLKPGKNPSQMVRIP